MCPEISAPEENEPQQPPPSRDDTSDEVPKLWSERGLTNATPLRRASKSTTVGKDRTEPTCLKCFHGDDLLSRAAYLRVTSEFCRAGIPRAVDCVVSGLKM